jgi:hypothetical protein
MQTIQTNPFQTYLDLAVQYCGDATLAMQAALMNGQAITDTPNASVNLPDAANDLIVQDLAHITLSSL